MTFVTAPGSSREHVQLYLENGESLTLPTNLLIPNATYEGISGVF